MKSLIWLCALALPLAAQTVSTFDPFPLNNRTAARIAILNPCAGAATYQMVVIDALSGQALAAPSGTLAAGRSARHTVTSASIRDVVVASVSLSCSTGDAKWPVINLLLRDPDTGEPLDPQPRPNRRAFDHIGNFSIRRSPPVWIDAAAEGLLAVGNTCGAAAPYQATVTDTKTGEVLLTQAGTLAAQGAASFVVQPAGAREEISAEVNVTCPGQTQRWPLSNFTVRDRATLAPKIVAGMEDVQ